VLTFGAAIESPGDNMLSNPWRQESASANPGFGLIFKQGFDPGTCGY